VGIEIQAFIELSSCSTKGMANNVDEVLLMSLTRLVLQTDRRSTAVNRSPTLCISFDDSLMQIA